MRTIGAPTSYNLLWVNYSNSHNDFSRLPALCSIQKLTDIFCLASAAFFWKIRIWLPVGEAHSLQFSHWPCHSPLFINDLNWLFLSWGHLNWWKCHGITQSSTLLSSDQRNFRVIRDSHQSKMHLVRFTVSFLINWLTIFTMCLFQWGPQAQHSDINH